jgi:inner membrane protein
VTGKTHFALGILSGVLLYQYMGLNMSSAAMVGVAAVGALLPDLDSPASTLGRLLPINPFSTILRHRGLLHSVSMLILGAALWYYNQQPLWLVFLLSGYASHLVGDALTVQGIPFFYPISFKLRLSPLPIQTGGIIDLLLFFSTWAGIAYLLFRGWL